MQKDEFNELVQSISEIGLLEPIKLFNGKILDGKHRYKACLEIGVTPKFENFTGTELEAVEYVRSKNKDRRHLNETQKGYVTLSLEEYVSKLKERAKENLSLGGGDRKSEAYKSPLTRVLNPVFETKSFSVPETKTITPVNVQKEIAKTAGVSQGTIGYIQKAIKAVEAGKLQPSVLEDMRNGKLAASKVAKQIRIEEKKVEAQSLPEGIYNVIYADPAWQYKNTGVDGAADNHYGTMSTDDICKFLETIELKIDKNAVLFMWVTNPLLEDALRVVNAWGFEYKTNMVWTKTNLIKPGSGFYVRGRHELLFICTKGNFTPLDKDISPPIGSVVEAPLAEHSKKPEIFYEIIERLYPNCNYIELFARNKRIGWDSYGNELRNE